MKLTDILCPLETNAIKLGLAERMRKLDELGYDSSDDHYRVCENLLYKINNGE